MGTKNRNSEIENKCDDNRRKVMSGENKGEEISGLLTSMRQFYILFGIFLVSFVFFAFTGNSSLNSTVEEVVFERRFHTEEYRAMKHLLGSVMGVAVLSILVIAIIGFMLKKSKTSFRSKQTSKLLVNRFKNYGSFERDNMDVQSQNILTEGYVGNTDGITRTVKMINM